MKERPILFSAPMVRAILEGRKTQTRRVIKPQPTFCERTGFSWKGFMYGIGSSQRETQRNFSKYCCPYGQPGDMLWVREKFQPLFADGFGHEEEEEFQPDYKTGKGYRISYPSTDGIFEFVNGDGDTTARCWPSIHMPRWASRITLEITGVRVERLNEINNADAMAEGVLHSAPHRHGAEGVDIEIVPGEVVADQYASKHNTGINDCYICPFKSLWESINGGGSWETNPWVWVVEFKVVQP